MSHFTTVATKLTQQKYIEAALTEMGKNFETGKVTISGYQSGKSVIEDGIKVFTNNSGYDIGIVKEKGNEAFSILADWYGLGNNKGETDFTNQLSQNYSFMAAKDKLKAKGFKHLGTTRKNGKIIMKLRRVV